MPETFEALSLGQAARLGLVVAVVVQVLLFFIMGFVKPGSGDGHSIALAGSAFYATDAIILLLVAHVAELRLPRPPVRLTIKVVMIFIAILALNLLFLHYWIDLDAMVRRTVRIVYVRSWKVGAVIIPLEFLLSMFNSTCLLFGAFRTTSSESQKAARSGQYSQPPSARSRVAESVSHSFPGSASP